MSENLRPLEILPYLRQKSILTDNDSQEVAQMCRNVSENAAVFLLLTFLPKRKPNTWYPDFMKILYENGSAHVVEVIDSEKYESKEISISNCFDIGLRKYTTCTLNSTTHLHKIKCKVI